MILDRLTNAEFYRPLGPRIASALDYLGRTPFWDTPDGRYELDAANVYAIVSRYQPKPPADAVWEAHRQYIDVQYVAEGVEQIGYAPLRDGLSVRTPYDEKKDSILYDAAGCFFDVPEGSFAIFTPGDVHAPGVAAGLNEAVSRVCKVVVKCRL
jgi:biofilm protein TabA